MNVKSYEMPARLSFSVEPFEGNVHMEGVGSIPGMIPRAMLMGRFYVILDSGYWVMADRYHIELAGRANTLSVNLEREAKERALFENTMQFLALGYRAKERWIEPTNSWGSKRKVYDWLDPWGRLFLQGEDITREKNNNFIDRGNGNHIPYVPLGTEFAQQPEEDEWCVT